MGRSELQTIASLDRQLEDRRTNRQPIIRPRCQTFLVERKSKIIIRHPPCPPICSVCMCAPNTCPPVHRANFLNAAKRGKAKRKQKKKTGPRGPREIIDNWHHPPKKVRNREMRPTKVAARRPRTINQATDSQSPNLPAYMSLVMREPTSSSFFLSFFLSSPAERPNGV
ncbi:hypothetical protein BC567DRAFT_99106 [Phyllosticta citribraziliensis]